MGEKGAVYAYPWYLLNHKVCIVDVRILCREMMTPGSTKYNGCCKKGIILGLAMLMLNKDLTVI
jgi:hypothetical protein